MISLRPRSSLSAREARALALRAQGIGGRPRQVGRAALQRVLLQQACVQLDSVNAVARSHELLAYSRLGPFTPADLYRVVYQNKTMFEYWGHAMSWVPMAEYRYFLPRMLRRRSEPRGWWSDVRSLHQPLYDVILNRIRDEGPLSSSDFEDSRASRGSWWDLKPAKLVLEDLFDQGVLMVADRRSGFQRVYDLTERVLPPGLNRTVPTEFEANRHLLWRGAQALGIGTLRDLADYFRLGLTAARAVLPSLLETGELVPVTVEGWPEPAYAAPDLLNSRPRRPTHPPVLISPFDPLVWERARASRIFGFDYRLEIYTPEPKRRYGYYVLPLLVDGALVGRVDARNDRAARTLRVPAAYLEDGESERVVPALAWALRDLARFLGAEHVSVTRAEPPELLAPLRRELEHDHHGVEAS